MAIIAARAASTRERNRQLGRGIPESAAVGAVVALAIAIAAAHALLLPLGKWQPDEFIIFHNLREYGWRAVAMRIEGWSPRPFSELLLALYGKAVLALGRPLITPCLGLMWAATASAVYFAARRAHRRPAAIAGALCAACMLLTLPREMFFWPAAALAYLPAWAALAVYALLRSAPAPTAALYAAAGAALLVAAGSSEIAAAFVVIEAGFLLGYAILMRLADGPVLRMPAWSWGPPLLLALIVLGVTATGRLHAGDTIAGPPGPTLGHPEASFIAAVPTFFRELISAPALGATGGAILLGIAVKAALFVGFQPPCPLPGADQRMQAWLRASALFGAAFLSIVLSYYQLGNALTQRHESLRQGLIVLALYTAARTIRSPFAAGARMTALAAALALAFAIRLPAIRTDLRLEGATVASRAATWRSGMTAGPAMTFTNAPIPRVASGWSLAPGAFQIDPARFNGGLDWKDFAILSFFGKQRLQVK